ncbi:hypothetical protein A2164_02445 [Candidatus Curtissbacteria bacterium RBG_13_35_7]|uniref:DUF3352 domain-containing protein n=1 Tax=Candidatus Curtissbacteria bacterium RBG_13_35_7 TaxID=1797705 RepID=A0A1F5G1B4_9BACT|nr:MAG: hypothetical protein A2164_02445 [Candidatus Curtissbacteria bacterium RBG_13_35_7]
MKLKPKKHLGFLVGIITVSLLTTIFLLPDSNQSQIFLESANNQFKVSFDITDSDHANLLKLFNNLNIPKSTEQGFSFELDSTSSAKLAYISPIKSKLSFAPRSISFNGNLSHEPFLSTFTSPTLNIPKNTNLAIFAPNLIDFVNAHYSYPLPITDWLKENVTQSSNQILIFYGESPNYALFIQNEQNDLSSLKNLKFDQALDIIYKEETQQDIIYHFFNIPSENDENPKNLSVFNFNNWLVLASSQETALFITDVQKSRSDSIIFPNDKNLKNINFMLYYNNPRDYQTSKNLLNMLLPNSDLTDTAQNSIAQALEKIENAILILKGNEFSGLIKVK